jgi:Tfp pilus assembly protein PilF
MAKQRPVTPTRPAKKRAPVKAARTARTRIARPARDPAPQTPAAREAVTAPPSSRKPAYYEAIALYESGVRALQKHDFEQAAAQFRTVLDKYPEEREIQERARLYLRVCERETARRPAGPQTPQERVYAATMCLNAGDVAGALEHLQRALEEAPNSDHAHYIMAVALTMRGHFSDALEHLQLALSLNPENRSLALQDPDLEQLREHEGFAETLETPRRRARPRAPH